MYAATSNTLIEHYLAVGSGDGSGSVSEGPSPLRPFGRGVPRGTDRGPSASPKGTQGGGTLAD